MRIVIRLSMKELIVIFIMMIPNLILGDGEEYWIYDPFSDIQKAFKVDFLEEDDRFYEKTDKHPGLILGTGVFVYVYVGDRLVKRVHFFNSIEGYDSELDYGTGGVLFVEIAKTTKERLTNYLHEIETGKRQAKSRTAPVE